MEIFTLASALGAILWGLMHIFLGRKAQLSESEHAFMGMLFLVLAGVLLSTME